MVELAPKQPTNQCSLGHFQQARKTTKHADHPNRRFILPLCACSGRQQFIAVRSDARPLPPDVLRLDRAWRSHYASGSARIPTRRALNRGQFYDHFIVVHDLAEDTRVAILPRAYPPLVKRALSSDNPPPQSEEKTA